VPFSAETVYQGVTKGESVHLLDYPEAHESFHDHELEAGVTRVRQVIVDGLALRKTNKLAVRQPLAALAVANELVREEALAELIKDELNVKEVVALDVGKHETWLRLPDVEEASENDIRLDPELTEDLLLEGQVRELFRAVQQLRKDAGLAPADKVTLYVDGQSAAAEALIAAAKQDAEMLRTKDVVAGTPPAGAKTLGEAEADAGGFVRLAITK
jgi:valyl-tRNA synthetase